jgi:hypothetical protein
MFCDAKMEMLARLWRRAAQLRSHPQQIVIGDCGHGHDVDVLERPRRATETALLATNYGIHGFISVFLHFIQQLRS